MYKKSVFIALASLFLLQCSNKLDVLAPYREGVAVYGLLNQNDTVQYIRVQRIFLGEGDAFSMAQNPDSCYFKPGELTVSLKAFSAGAQVGPDIVLTEAYVQTQPGIFNTNQLLYKTNHPLSGNYQYRLIVHNNKSGSNFSSSNVSLIGDIKAGLGHYSQSHPPSVLAVNPNPPTPIPSVPIVPSNGSVGGKFDSPTNAAVCGLTMRFYYTEYAGVSGSGVSKSVDIGLGIQYLTSQRGGEQVDLTFGGDAMLSDISHAIQVDPNVDHRTADSVVFIINAAGYDLSLYNQVNGSTSLSQSKPTYTNIYEGVDGSGHKVVGILSCRKEYLLTKMILGTSVERLSTDPVTCPLKFYYNGALSTTCP